jgi:hypothetical protein
MAWGVHHSNLLLTNSNRTLTQNGQQFSVLSAAGARFVTSGKYYWELVLNADLSSGGVLESGNSFINIGIANSSFDATLTSPDIGGTTNAYQWYTFTGPPGSTNYNGTYQFPAPAFAQGNIAQIALDATNHTMWLNVNNTGWVGNNGNPGDPASGTNGIPLAIGLYTGGLAPAISFQPATSNQVTGNFAPANWTYSAPTGFGSIDTQVFNITQTISGIGSLTANATVPSQTIKQANAIIGGVGGITAVVIIRAHGVALFQGAGLLSVATSGPIPGSARLSGSGSVTMNERIIAQGRAVIPGTGDLSVFFQPIAAPPPIAQPTPVEHIPVDDYLNLIPSYNAIQPKFMATLRASLQPFADQQKVLAGMPQAFDLDTAIGTQLDQVGIWIGRDRFVETPISGVYFSWDTPGLGWEQGTWQGTFDPSEGLTTLDDETYRQLLYAKVGSNNWDSSPQTIVDVLTTLLEGQGASAVSVIDNNNMTITVNVDGSLNSAVFRSLILNGEIPIKPAGVGISYNLPPHGQATNWLAEAILAGSGSVIVNAIITRPGTQFTSANLVGSGTVTATAIIRDTQARATIAGVGTVVSIATLRAQVRATITGFGGRTFNATVNNNPFSSDFSSDFGFGP